MPRVRAHVGQPAASLASSSSASPHRTSQLALNDDKEEKAKRLQSRHALHSQQMKQIKAAVATTPQRKRKSLGVVGEGDPATPVRDHDPYGEAYGVHGEHVTPMKRVPILANFEEWMKMATDNKINAANSWNFALIDYFHDMSLLKEGDGVNFQKASCTLDGCVKIYTSRVDSVATETGKLLSGLADSGGQKRSRGGAEGDAAADGDDGEEEETGEEGAKKKGKRKAQRSAEATLVTSFDHLRLKKMELEFSVDPLFKKASADFDEGGAKGLLLNHLSIDHTGRIVFDSSDDADDAAAEEARRDSMDPEGATADKREDEGAHDDGPVDVAALGARFFPSLSQLDLEDICPTLKTFELGGSDASADPPFLKAPENWRDEHPENGSADHKPGGEDADLHDRPGGFDAYDDDDAAAVGLDMGPDVGFGEGGEAWARDAALQPQPRTYVASTETDPADEGAGEVGVFDTNARAFGVRLQHRPEQEHVNILGYFDDALQKNWAGPEHWKIARIKEAHREGPKRTRKEKEPFEIDFAAPMSHDLAALLYTPAANNSSISMPRKEWKSRTRNLLPDDKHFSSQDLLKLFLKPKAKLGGRQPGPSPAHPAGDLDEAYWASHGAGAAAPRSADDDDDGAVAGDYDADFFQDDGLPMPGGAAGAGGVDDDEDDDFADAREAFSPGHDAPADAAAEGPTGAGIDGVTDPREPGSDAFGANLVAQSRRLRPEYVQYARVAKRVDMRRLKDEMWHGIGLARPDESEQPSKQERGEKEEQSELRFTDIMNGLQDAYPEQQMRDISTSFGFICLLHLANEKGLVIGNVDGWTDLTVRRDHDAQLLTEAA